MKKWISIILCIFLLAGCSSAPDGASETATEHTPSDRYEANTLPESTTEPESSLPSESAPSGHVPEQSSTAVSSKTDAAVSPAPSKTESTVSTAVSEPVASEPPAPTPNPTPTTPEEFVSAMTTEELVGQLFLARFPATDATALQDIKDCRLGGYILFKRDFEGMTPTTIRQRVARCNSVSRIPMFFAVDEEGGRVTRVSCIPAFRNAPFLSPREIFNANGLDGLRQTEQEKSVLLHNIGLNINMAPVCDITTDPAYFMYPRSLGQSPETTGKFAEIAIAAAAKNNICAVLKHFPGYGNNVDTHTDIAVDNRSLAELEQLDLIPFQIGIAAGCGAILISHNIVTALDGKYPATLSPAVHRYLRDTMGFGGVIITDDLSMKAITKAYGEGEAAVLAVLAGNDLLCSTAYKTQYAAVLNAVGSGRIPLDDVRRSVLRIIKLKKAIGLIA